MAVKRKKNKCKKNPGKAKVNKGQRKLYETFHSQPPKGARVTNFNIEKGLVVLGKADGILYVSDKWGNPGQKYIHKFKKPYPVLFSNLQGNTLVIKGNFKIKPGGITG